MRLLGFASLALVVLSFVCWLAGWIYWNLFVSGANYNSMMTKVVQGVTFTGNLLEFLALLLLAAGLIVGGKKVQTQVDAL